MAIRSLRVVPVLALLCAATVACGGPSGQRVTASEYEAMRRAALGNTRRTIWKYGNPVMPDAT